MKNFDHNGLLLCEFQGKIFEKSAELDCSSSVFLRRFLHSNLSKALDDNTNSNLSLDAEEGLSQYTVTFHIPENSQQNLLCKFFPINS